MAKNFLDGPQRMKLGTWVSSNWQRLTEAKASQTEAGKQATAALGYTVTGNNVESVADMLGLPPLIDSGHQRTSIDASLGAQLRAAGELTVETLGTLQTTLTAVVAGQKALEAKIDALAARR